jgi:hypothetical protein
VKFFRPVTCEYQVRMRIYQPGSNNRSLGINNGYTITWRVGGMLENWLGIIVSTNPDNRITMDGYGCI